MFRTTFITLFATLATATIASIAWAKIPASRKVSRRRVAIGSVSGGGEMVSRMSYLRLAAVLAAAASLVLSASPTAGASAPSDDAPVTASRFSITIDGVDLGQWSKVDGLAAASGSPRTVVLGRGTSTSLGIFTWHRTVVEGQLSAARDAVIVAYGADGQPVARYHLENAWPTKVELGLKSGGSEVSYESVTLVCQNLHRVSP